MKKASLKYRQLIKKGLLNGNTAYSLDPYYTDDLEVEESPNLPSRFILTDKYPKAMHGNQNTVTPQANFSTKISGDFRVVPPSPSKSIYELVT